MSPKPAAKTKKIPYATSVVAAMEEKFLARVQEKTGKSYEAWRRLLVKEGPTGSKERVAWLKKQHGLPSMTAHFLANERYAKADAYDPERCVAEQFAGPKAALLPLYETLVWLGLGCGEDVSIRPCQTMIPLYRKHVFMQLTAATATRLDVGLALGARPAGGRVEVLTAGKGNRITHVVRVSTAKDIDGELAHLVQAAYELGAGAIERHANVKEGKEAKLPADFARALKADKSATKTFNEACTPRMRADFVDYVTGVKTAEARARRIEGAIRQLAAGKKKMYC
jgi:hypothetical protein